MSRNSGSSAPHRWDSMTYWKYVDTTSRIRVCEGVPRIDVEDTNCLYCWLFLKCKICALLSHNMPLWESNKRRGRAFKTSEIMSLMTCSIVRLAVAPRWSGRGDA